MATTTERQTVIPSVQATMVSVDACMRKMDPQVFPEEYQEMRLVLRQLGSVLKSLEEIDAIY